MSDVPVNRLAPVAPDNRKMVVSADTPITEWPTSLEVGSSKWKACLVNAQLTPDYHLTAGEFVDFVMCDWLIQWASRDNAKTGEHSEFRQLVLFNREGDTLASSGEYVSGHLQKGLKLYTRDELAAGIKVRLVAKLSGNKRTYHQLKFVPE